MKTMINKKYKYRTGGALVKCTGSGLALVSSMAKFLFDLLGLLDSLFEDFVRLICSFSESEKSPKTTNKRPEKRR